MPYEERTDFATAKIKAEVCHPSLSNFDLKPGPKENLDQDRRSFFQDIVGFDTAKLYQLLS